ncbi:alcohol dehydrogenase catalytic domain-containing protein [Microbispora corallina]|uniref:alcohol dehydrogenase n=1 Tax=Microbispora corallina TaxID=83302 RepID=A0ABQ4G2A7_9ACTN|nr:alcohol dehydrogenase catalytic domain-containing protein [Microbispora corallina]GIH41207.1 alcohol dehydrogenase [Microbispora corallina]
MSGYRAFTVSGAGHWALAEREAAQPGPGQVRLRVEACGVCATDALAVNGLFRPDPSAPIVPGHEIVGRIDAIGEGVTGRHVGERVGVGFLGGHCGVCEQCRRGDFVNCTAQPLTGTTVDGGYAEVAYAKANALVGIPEAFDSVEAAPLLCAGLTVYSALRDLGARPGALVAVQGIGGLGHLGLQYASKLGYEVVAISRGGDKADLAASLGARHYIDGDAEEPGEALRRLGGAAGIIATAASGASMSPLIPGLAPRGRLIVVGAGLDPITVTPGDLIFGERTISGTITGRTVEGEDNLAFTLSQGIRPITEVLPLSEAPKAYERLRAGRARFRIVLDPAA